MLGVDGQTERFPACTPAELLLRAVEIDYTQLRDEVMRLWEQYPMDGVDRAAKKEELAHLLEEVREAAEPLRESDRLGSFYVTQRLERNRPLLEAALASEDVDLMEAGELLLNMLEAPAMAQVRLRNMFEVAFDGMERATQRERFERLASAYPPVVERHFPMRRLVGKGNAALRIYDTLRHRRASEYSDLLAVSVDEGAQERIRAYDAWDAEARAAREAYVKGGIDAAEFLRRIGYDGEAELTATSDSGKSEWRRRVERSISFDPWMEYRGMMTLDLTADAPQWELTSAAEQVREAQGEHRSLRDRYGKK